MERTTATTLLRAMLLGEALFYALVAWLLSRASLHGGDARAEVLTHRRQRGQVQVGGDRAECGDRCEQDQQRPVRKPRGQRQMPMQTYLSSV